MSSFSYDLWIVLKVALSIHDFSQLPREKSRGRMKKRTTYYGRVITFSFLPVKVIVKEMLIKALKTPKKAIFRQFLRTDSRNLPPEIFLRDFQYVIRMQTIFKWIRAINRTDS